MTDRGLAPAPLDLVQTFVNTADLETGEDVIGTAPGLTTWLSERGLLVSADGDRIGASDVRRAIAAREALRDLIEANAGEDASPDALRTLASVADDAQLRLRFDADGRSRLEPKAGGAVGALGRLLAIVADATADGTWDRLKVCREDTCRWAFYDSSRNRSGVWCTMAVCGNREKVRRYRSRQGSIDTAPAKPSPPADL